MPKSNEKQLNVEYSIRVNEVGDKDLPSLTLSQLWKGLVLKLTHPQKFSEQVGECRVQWINDIQFIREQQFPAFVIEDKVTLTPEQKIQVRSLASVTEAFSLTILIRSESDAALIVTYQYQRASANEDGLDVDNYLAEAYKQADEASILKMKQMVGSGDI